jgi:Fic family protein
MFYMSGYLEGNRRQYYSYLHGISQEKNWNGWIAFFLKGVDEQARENSRKVHAIKALYENMKREVIDLTHSQYSIAALDEIFNRPIFKTSDFTVNTGIPKPTSMKILRILKDARILTTIREGAGQKAAILAYKELLDIAEGRTQQESA